MFYYHFTVKYDKCESFFFFFFFKYELALYLQNLICQSTLSYVRICPIFY